MCRYWAERLTQKRFGIVIILCSLSCLQTTNYHLESPIHRKHRNLQGISPCPWWVWLLFLPGSQKQCLRSSFWDLWGCPGGCSSNPSFESRKDGGLHPQHVWWFRTSLCVCAQRLWVYLCKYSIFAHPPVISRDISTPEIFFIINVWTSYQHCCLAG